MTRRTMPVGEAIGMVDRWASVIAEHAATDRNLSRVGHEIRQALGNVETLAQAPMPPEYAREFRRATAGLLSVVRPFLNNADRKRCGELLRYIEQPVKP